LTKRRIERILSICRGAEISLKEIAQNQSFSITSLKVASDSDKRDLCLLLLIVLRTRTKIGERQPWQAKVESQLSGFIGDLGSDKKTS
jgi:hypothetical protein